MRTLVTGATGFIGRHLVNTLYEKGSKIRCLVRGNSHVEHLKREGIELIYGDLSDKDTLQGAVKGIDIIYHLAGEVYSTKSNNYYHVNVIGAKNILESCLSEKIKKFVYLSSTSVTGPNPSRDILLNEKSPCHPITPYGESKYEAERLVLKFYEDHKLPVVIIRPPIVYGPGVSHSSRVFMFLRLIQKGLFRTIGDGNNLISLCYIDNLIHGIMLAGENKVVVGEIYYIADERPYTINEIAQAIAKEEGVKLSGSHIPIWLANILAVTLVIPAKLFGFVSPLSRNTVREVRSNWTCDISKAQRELGYRAIIRFEEGVKKTVEWYREYHKTENNRP